MNGLEKVGLLLFIFGLVAMVIASIRADMGLLPLGAGIAVWGAAMFIFGGD